MKDWREVDGQLRSLAVRRAALDAEEARLLREAERLQIWREVGMVSALDYLERVLGYAPHAAMERLRVARALEALPVIETALEAGQLSFSAVRELTRVATPATEAEWFARALGKNVRQVEDLVAGHTHGDRPDDPVDPNVQRHTVTLDLSAEVYARWRQAQTTLADERGARLDDDAFATQLLEGTFARTCEDGEPTGRAKFQIMLTLCRHCNRGWQEGGGQQVLVDPETVERAKCDAQWVGSTDDAQPARASQDIPPATVRFVWRRDGGKCQTPGCRSTVGLEVHHKKHRADGGTHEPENLQLLCWGCHSSIHRGTLELVGGEPRRPNEPSHVGRERSRQSTFDAAAMRVQARDALVALGWKPAIARSAVDEAASHVGRDAPIEQLVRESLRRCPRPAA